MYYHLSSFTHSGEGISLVLDPPGAEMARKGRILGELRPLARPGVDTEKRRLDSLRPLDVLCIWSPALVKYWDSLQTNRGWSSGSQWCRGVGWRKGYWAPGFMCLLASHPWRPACQRCPFLLPRAITLENTLVILSTVAPDAGRYYVQAVNDKNGDNKTSQPITLAVESKSACH